MKKTHLSLLFVLFVGFVFSGTAQQRIDIRLVERPVTELFSLIEEQSSWRVYAPRDEELDSLFITVSESQILPQDLLNKVFQESPFQVSVYGQSLFVLRERQLVTTIPNPRVIHLEARHSSPPAPVESTSGNFRLARQELGASSDFKVYEVGNPDARSSGRVTMNGYVYDALTGEPVAGVILQIEGTYTATHTDAYGYYTFNLTPGDYTINILGAGQEDTRRHVKLHSEGRFDILSTEKVHTFREITVYGDRRDNVRQTVIGVERLQMQNIKNVPTVFGEADILRIVAMLPGVKTGGEISSGFNVRGGATDQNLILYNGGTIYNPNHLFGLFSAFNPDIVRDMELFKSSIPSKYGGRISSVLDINSREGNKKQFQGSASIGLLTSRLTFEGPIVKDRTSFIIGGRTTYSDWLIGQIPEKSGFRDGSADFYDLNATLSHKFDEYNHLYVSGYLSKDRFKFDYFDRYQYYNKNATVRWRRIFSNELSGVFSAGWDHYDYQTLDTETESMGYRLDFGIDQYFGKMDFTHRIDEKHQLTYGLNSTFYNLNPGRSDPYGETSLVAPDKLQREKALESAVYIGDKWDITPSIALDLGVRYSIFNVLGTRDYNTYAPGYLPSETTLVETKTDQKGVLKTYHGPEFRAAARFAFGSDFSVKAGVNSMRQYIHKISNTMVMTPTDTWKLSDMNIKPQRGVQYALGVYKDIKDQFVEFSVEGYYKTMKDYLDYRHNAELVMNHTLETDVLNTRGRAYGAEFMVRRTEGKLNGWASYTYSRTELIQDDPIIIDPVNGGNWYPADFDKPHEFKLVGNYKFTHRFSLSLNCEYATGRPITLPVSKYGYAGGEFVYYTDRNTYRIPDYFRMDVSFNIEPSHHLTLLTHSMISIGVYNLTGRKNAHSIYYKQENGKINGYKLSIFGAAIPYASYNIKF